MSNDRRVDALRPERLEEFGGQPDVSRELSIVLGAAKGRGQLPDHMVFSGPPGLGKTSLAHIVANELGLPIHTTSGPAIEKPGELASLLSGLNRPSVVFIDEIHRLPRIVEEYLYSPMEDGMLEVIMGEGAKARTVRLPLERFVLVGATTQLGLLSAPLRDRFGFTGRLKLYDDEALARIVQRSAKLLQVQLTEEGSLAIAGRSRGTPRIANRWLRRVRDWAQVNEVEEISADVAVEALEAFQVDSLGLDALGREILSTLVHQFGGGPVGLNTLAAAVNEAPGTLEEVYEPYLMRKGMLARTPRGRVATAGAYKHLQLEVPASVVLASGEAVAVNAGESQDTVGDVQEELPLEQ